jgi:subtilase family serine protease
MIGVVPRERFVGCLAGAVLSVVGVFVGVDVSAASLRANFRPAAFLSGRTEVAGDVASDLAVLRPLGPAVSTTPARVLIALQHRDQAGLLRFIARVSDPSSPMYEHYLSARQFVARYGPRPSTVRAVEAFARGFGLRVVSVPSNRAYVYATGSVARMERAFDTRIDSFRLHGNVVRAPRTELSVPTRLAGAITAVDGLNTADVATPADTPPLQAYVDPPPQSAYWGQLKATQVPRYDGTVLPYTDYGYTPQQLEGAYGVSKAIAAGLNGNGQTVAVIDAYSSPRLSPTSTRGRPRITCRCRS